ncbi:hypothetical protein LXH09_37195 [Streptomyces sp. CS7]|uniref:hypothetical protein n=1 Tax=Streptomyces sp. CS-7 TaxID=2906769 RepID=UPI0021B45CA7|nr:hypothetical protein [Streptomyces sp. CS-7]MCT6782261.1 hypothetical protein [Streptomyces sp. CS-7]
MPRELVLICRKCCLEVGQDDGYLWAHSGEVNAVGRFWRTWKAEHTEPDGMRSGTTGQKPEYPEPAVWRAHHQRCDPDRDEMHYRIPADRLHLRADLLDWTAHLMEKAWLAQTDWREVIRETRTGGTRFAVPGLDPCPEPAPRPALDAPVTLRTLREHLETTSADWTGAAPETDLLNLRARLDLCEQQGDLEHSVSLRKLAVLLGMSTAGVSESNDRLVQAGWLLRRPASTRGGAVRWTLTRGDKPTPDRARGGYRRPVPPLVPPPASHARRTLTTEQRQLADRLHRRADTLRGAAAEVDDPGLSIRDAVDLAAVQLGLQAHTS